MKQQQPTSAEIVDKMVRSFNRFHDLRRRHEDGEVLEPNEMRELIALRTRRALIVTDRMVRR